MPARSTIAKRAAEAATRTVGEDRLGFTTSAIVVPIGLIRPNPWNPNVMDDEMFQKELKSIRKYGFVDPLTVREVHQWVDVTTYGDADQQRVRGDLDHYQIIDGEHRWKAGEQLGYAELPCWNLGEIDDATAEELTIILNETRGKSNEERLRSVLQDIISKRGGDTAVREIMPFDRARFDELIGKISVDWDQLEQRRQAVAAAGRWKELVFRVPMEAAETIERAIDEVKAREEFEDRWRALEMICADSLA